MRKTKIICTLGPSTDKPGMVEKLVNAGMNVARLNFSHGTREEQLARINEVKRVRKKLGVPVGILLDTKGPEIRIGIFEKGSVILEEGQEFTLTSENIIGDNVRVSVSFDKLSEYLKKDDKVLIDDGLIELLVKKIKNNDIICTVINGGRLSNKKSINLPGVHIEMPYMTERDRDDIIFGIDNEVDFIAASFVRNKDDIIEIKKIFEQKNEQTTKIIAKIENQEGVNNADEILAEANGIMIARGDLGVEISFEKLPEIQKRLIKKCYAAGKMAITATQMLDSMIHNPRPTRAEVSDVANAVYDGSSAVMLSGETAAGKYPVKTIKTMSKICETTEASIDYTHKYQKHEFKIQNTMDAISHSVCSMAIDIEAKAIVVCSLSGTTARMVSRFRPPVDIIGLSISKKTWRALSLSWGIIPALCVYENEMELLFDKAKIIAKTQLNLQKGDKIIITGANAMGKVGSTNTIRIEIID